MTDNALKSQIKSLSLKGLSTRLSSNDSSDVDKVVTPKLTRSYSKKDITENNAILDMRVVLTPESKKSTYKSIRFDFMEDINEEVHDIEDVDVKEVESKVCFTLTPNLSESSIFENNVKYPIDKIPILHKSLNLNLTLEDFSDMKHIADGSNANIFTATYQNETVIVKIIKEISVDNSLAIKEFDFERDILLRLNHPNIIKLIGSGETPRKFLVLEYLKGGSLGKKLDSNLVPQSSSGEFFHTNTFTYLEFLKYARDLADAFNYLHSNVCTGVSIIHRDLKPDNIGFTDDGTLKLFDFGLTTVVKSRNFDSEVYLMTGNTGSLRYMAPEVSLNKGYNEKVDVYSFGIVVWQSLCDKIPFNGLSKEDFHKYVIIEGFRLKPNNKWPKEFCELLNNCWHSNYTQRPSFQTIIEELDNLITKAEDNILVNAGTCSSCQIM